jgi:hypothetical protein
MTSSCGLVATNINAAVVCAIIRFRGQFPLRARKLLRNLQSLSPRAPRCYQKRIECSRRVGVTSTRQAIWADGDANHARRRANSGPDARCKRCQIIAVRRALLVRLSSVGRRVPDGPKYPTLRLPNVLTRTFSVFRSSRPHLEAFPECAASVHFAVRG